MSELFLLTTFKIIVHINLFVVVNHVFFVSILDPPKNRLCQSLVFYHVWAPLGRYMEDAHAGMTLFLGVFTNFTVLGILEINLLIFIFFLKNNKCFVQRMKLLVQISNY